MITEERLQEMLGVAAEELPLPEAGSDRVLAEAAGSHRAAKPGWTTATSIRRHRVVLGLSTAAVAAVITGLVVVNTNGTPSNAPTRVSASNSLAGGGALAAPGTARSPGYVAAALPAAPQKSAASSGASSGQTLPAKIASKGSLALSIPRSALNGDVRRIGEIAAGAGGYVSSTSLVQPGSANTGSSIVLDIPAAAFQGVIGSVEQLGRLRSLNTSATDLTEQYNDTAAQLQALTATRSQLETLLTRATKVSDLLDIENQIESVQSQINVLESQQRTVAHEVAYATLAVQLAPRPATAAASRRNPLDRAWSSAVSGFAGALRWLLSIAGDVLFALLMAAAVLLIARLGQRHLLPRLRRMFL